MDWFIQNAPMIALFFFFAAFIGIAAWAFQPRRKQALQTLAEIPLNEDNNGRK